MSLIEKTFNKLRQEGKKAFIPFIMAGDPNRDIFKDILFSLPDAGADIIEIGMPFTDPMADGEIIQEAGMRALASGQTLKKTLEDIAFFKQHHPDIPIILMGYYNPIYIYGLDHFFKDASESGCNGLIIVDIPPEENQELRPYLSQYEIDMIRLVTPTTSIERLKFILQESSGFLYYVSVTGVTGGKSADYSKLKQRIEDIKNYTSLPICIGFGIKNKEDIQKALETNVDGIIMGSSIIKKMATLKEGQKNLITDFIHEMSLECHQ